MRKYLKTVAISIIVIFSWMGIVRYVKAQTVVPPITIQSTIPHTSCALSTTGTTSYCFASDGLWSSTSGGVYVQLTPGGVTSFNGRTGAVVPVPSDYPDTVTSVNGKTGAVVLGATTSIQ